MNNSIHENRTYERGVRALIDFFSHKTIIEPSVSGSSSELYMALPEGTLSKGVDSPGQAGMRTASQLITDGGELVRTPLKWVQHMQTNWLIYVVCAAIICLSLLFFYCMARRYLAGKTNSNTGFTSHLANLALMMAQHQPPTSNDRLSTKF